MKPTLWLVLGLAISSTTLAAAPAAPTPAAPSTTRPAMPDPALPPVRERNGLLVDLKGRGLYVYAGDTERSRSFCDAQCELLWPPLLADPGARPRGPFSIAVRTDGKRQWALRGKPLYRWRGDSKRGDAGGDGINGVWMLVHVTAPAVTP